MCAENLKEGLMKKGGINLPPKTMRPPPPSPREIINSNMKKENTKLNKKYIVCFINQREYTDVFENFQELNKFVQQDLETDEIEIYEITPAKLGVIQMGYTLVSRD